MWLKIFIFTYLLVASVAGKKEAREVNTSNGAVRGYKDPKHDLFAFYGIPYATAPIGPHKFEAPLPAPLWLATLEAVEEKIMCRQVESQYTQMMKFQGDCLIANVYTPNTKEKKLPVVVYIHGGAFQVGYGNLLTPKQLVSTTKVIAVTFNYRLGAHGFLCLGTKAIPGNAGLKDQIALLKWVKQNIENFGGNPKDVTIAGYSAGASSVDLLMLSPATKDLFNKVILDSASSLGPAVVMDPIETATKYATSVLNATNVDEIYALEDFYLNAPTEILTKEMRANLDGTVAFGPCVERYIDGQEVLTEAPITILKRGKFRRVPMLYGFSSMEGLFHLEHFGDWVPLMNKKFSDFLPADLQFENEEEKNAVAMKVKEYYFGEKPVAEHSILKYIDYEGDITFSYPVLRAAKLNVEAGNEQVYLYEFSYTDKNTAVVPFLEIPGATHCAQTTMVLDESSGDETNLPEETQKMRSIMREMWSNFIKTGSPVPVDSDLPAWPAVNASWSPHMGLTMPLELRGQLLPDRGPFWDEIYAKYSRVPTAPPTPPTRHSEL